MNYFFNGVCLQNRRPSNMDSLLLKSGCINGEDALLAVVCDGVGSFAEGAFASGTSARMLGEWFAQLTHMERIGLRMRDAILDINSYIVSKAKQKSINTASTLSALLLVQGAYYIAHVGDSRIYHYEDDRISLLTNDDVSVSGKLTSCVGQREHIILQYSEGMTDSKVFLLCTDGLYKRMNLDFMLAELKSLDKQTLKASVDSLTQYVVACGEKDNISLALIKIES